MVWPKIVPIVVIDVAVVIIINIVIWDLAMVDPDIALQTQGRHTVFALIEICSAFDEA